MSVPLTGWHKGSWNTKLRQFCRLTGMLGLHSPNPSPTELQEVFRRVSSARVFGESVQSFLDATGKDLDAVKTELEAIEDRLGLLEPLPFMSVQKGVVDPRTFEGVAIWPAGIANWGATLRPDEIAKAINAGAGIKRTIVLWSSRKCDAPADRRHPLIRDLAVGDEPNERELAEMVVERRSDLGDVKFADLPMLNDNGKPLSLREQFGHMARAGQLDELVGRNPVYVPSTPNSLYVALHVARILWRWDIYTSQAGGRAVRVMPDGYHQALQDVMTTPNGILRLLVELKSADYITDSAHNTRAYRSK